jgi:hypothetical protein
LRAQVPRHESTPRELLGRRNTGARPSAIAKNFFYTFNFGSPTFLTDRSVSAEYRAP